MLLRPFLVAAALVSASLALHATPLTGAFAVSVSEGVQNGVAFNASNVNPFSGANTASATFTYTGAINFSNTAGQNAPPPAPLGDINGTFFSSAGGAISNYNGTGTVTYNGTIVANYNNAAFPSLPQAGFLAASGSASGYAYGSYYTFNLGNLLAGTILTITHDDGVAVYQGTTLLGGTTLSPTAQVTEKVTVGNSGQPITLYYARENGSPSVLQIDASAVPEPSSIALLGTGLLGMAGMVRRRFAA